MKKPLSFSGTCQRCRRRLPLINADDMHFTKRGLRLFPNAKNSCRSLRSRSLTFHAPLITIHSISTRLYPTRMNGEARFTIVHLGDHLALKPGSLYAKDVQGPNRASTCSALSYLWDVASTLTGSIRYSLTRSSLLQKIWPFDLPSSLRDPVNRHTRLQNFCRFRDGASDLG